MAEEPGLAPIRAAHAEEDADGRGLAGAVGAEQGHHLPLMNCQVHPPEGLDLAEALVDTAELRQDIRSRFRASRLIALLRWHGRFSSA